MDQPEILSECIVKIESVPDDEAEEKASNSTESWEPYSLKRIMRRGMGWY
ncbi:Protein of unknown function [Gryllus bimaculatus]|nr:Protein of unknown function [Gryllus bimaculatus]